MQPIITLWNQLYPYTYIPFHLPTLILNPIPILSNYGTQIMCQKTLTTAFCPQSTLSDQRIVLVMHVDNQDFPRTPLLQIFKEEVRVQPPQTF